MRTLILGVALLAATTACNPTPADEPAPAPRATYQVLVERLVNDPRFVQYRDVVRVDGSYGPSYCGEVNVINQNGIYTGFRHFVVNGGKARITQDDPLGDDFTYRMVCLEDPEARRSPPA